MGARFPHRRSAEGANDVEHRTDSRVHPRLQNVTRARKFYEGTLGLTPKEEFAHGVIYECGGAEVFMYPTPNAGTSRASQAFWQVEDVEAEVVELKARGVNLKNTTCQV